MSDFFATAVLQVNVDKFVPNDVKQQLLEENALEIGRCVSLTYNDVKEICDDLIAKGRKDEANKLYELFNMCNVEGELVLWIR